VHTYVEQSSSIGILSSLSHFSFTVPATIFGTYPALPMKNDYCEKLNERIELN